MCCFLHGALSTVMQTEAQVVSNRDPEEIAPEVPLRWCDFSEPHGGTHSWRVLDADNNVAVFLQEHTSGKFGIALGTWAEDFESDIAIDTPRCARGMSDFFEKQGEQARCFPVVTCPAPSPHRC